MINKRQISTSDAWICMFVQKVCLTSTSANRIIGPSGHLLNQFPQTVIFKFFEIIDILYNDNLSFDILLHLYWLVPAFLSTLRNLFSVTELALQMTSVV